MIHPRPVEHALGVTWVVIGLLILLAVVTPWEPSLAIAHLSPAIQSLIGAPILAGGLLVLCGLRKRSALSTRGTDTIRAGAILACGGWVADVVCVTILHPSATVQIVLAAQQAWVAWRWNRVAAAEADTLRVVHGQESS